MNKAVPGLIGSSVEAVSNEFDYLGLLARVKKALQTGREISVPFADIRPFPAQPREHFNAEAIRRLSASIDAGGQTSSGMVRARYAEFAFEVLDTGTAVVPRQIEGNSRYELIDGERRWRGVGLIPFARRPLYRAKLIEADDDVVQYLISGITNFNREGHTAIEVMKTVDRHLSFGFPLKEIANLLGISEHWARQIHGLKNLKQEHQVLLSPDLPRAQQLPILAAIQISKIEPRLQNDLVRRVLAKEVTVGSLRSEVVRVARREGSHIRTREVEPRRQWESFGRKLGQIGRTVSDASGLLSKEEVARFAASNKSEAEEHLRVIDATKKMLDEIESMLRKTLVE